MKKFITLLVLVSLTLLSCNKDDNPGNSNETNLFNPPTWIQGEWEYKLEVTKDVYNIHKYTFSKNNIIQYIEGKTGATTNVTKTSLDFNTIHTKGASEITEENEEGVYTIIIKPNTPGVETTPMRQVFKKIEGGKIQHSVMGNNAYIYAKK